MWNKAQRRLKHAPTDVYRAYDVNGRLLYVGAAVNVFARMREHRAYAEWWPFAASGSVHRYENRTVARHVEAVAIRDEKPLYNVTAEVAELRRVVEVTDPVEELALFWEEGEVWVDENPEHQA